MLKTTSTGIFKLQSRTIRLIHDFQIYSYGINFMLPDKGYFLIFKDYKHSIMYAENRF